MHSIATFARNNSVGWGFLTVILGALFVLSGWLPLQLLGTVMIVVGMVTPIALTSLPPQQLQASVRANPRVEVPTSTPRRRERPEVSDPSDLPQRRPSQPDGLDQSMVELMQHNEILRYELISTYGTLTLLSDKVAWEIVEHSVRHVEAEPGNATSSEIELLWQQTINGTDIQSIAYNLGVTAEHALKVQQQALDAALVSPLLHALRQQRAS